MLVVNFYFRIFTQDAAMEFSVMAKLCFAQVAVSWALPAVGMDTVCNSLEDREAIWILYLYIAPLAVHDVQIRGDSVFSAQLFHPTVDHDVHFRICPDLEIRMSNGKLPHAVKFFNTLEFTGNVES